MEHTNVITGFIGVILGGFITYMVELKLKKDLQKEEEKKSIQILKLEFEYIEAYIPQLLKIFSEEKKDLLDINEVLNIPIDSGSFSIINKNLIFLDNYKKLFKFYRKIDEFSLEYKNFLFSKVNDNKKIFIEMVEGELNSINKDLKEVKKILNNNKYE